MTLPEVRDLGEDCDYVVEATAEPHEDGTVYSVGFTAYRIVARDDDGPWFAAKGSASNDPVTRKPAEAPVFLHGFIKWDGCSHWHFDAQEDCMIHLCGEGDAEQLGTLFKRLFEMAKAIMGREDLS